MFLSWPHVSFPGTLFSSGIKDKPAYSSNLCNWRPKLPRSQNENCLCRVAHCGGGLRFSQEAIWRVSSKDSIEWRSSNHSAWNSASNWWTRISHNRYVPSFHCELWGICTGNTISNSENLAWPKIKLTATGLLILPLCRYQILETHPQSRDHAEILMNLQEQSLASLHFVPNRGHFLSFDQLWRIAISLFSIADWHSRRNKPQGSTCTFHCLSWCTTTSESGAANFRNEVQCCGQQHPKVSALFRLFLSQARTWNKSWGNTFQRSLWFQCPAQLAERRRETTESPLG